MSKSNNWLWYFIFLSIDSDLFEIFAWLRMNQKFVYFVACRATEKQKRRFNIDNGLT